MLAMPSPECSDAPGVRRRSASHAGQSGHNAPGARQERRYTQKGGMAQGRYCLGNAPQEQAFPKLELTALLDLFYFCQHVRPRSFVCQRLRPITILPLNMLYCERYDTLRATTLLAQKARQLTWL